MTGREDRRKKKFAVHWKNKAESPALAVIGKGNRLRKDAAWFEKKSLAGKTVLMTRPKGQAAVLREILEARGARVIESPVIKILPPKEWAPLDSALQDLRSFDWIVFTSTNGVDSVLGRVKALGKDARLLAPVKIAAIGEATVKRLEENGIRADFMAGTYTSAVLLESLKKMREVRSRRFLLPRTDIAPEELRKGLEAGGGIVTEVIAYRTIPVRSAIGKRRFGELFSKKKVDYVTFTSASTVRYFFEALPRSLRKRIKDKVRFVSIGPVTSRKLREYGARPYREAEIHTMSGLVAALENGQRQVLSHVD